MKKIKHPKYSYRLSASDLAGHVGCTHIAYLNKEHAAGRIEKPNFVDHNLERIKILGNEHEERYVRYLIDQGLQVTKLNESVNTSNGFEATVEAMRSGSEVIVQCVLQHLPWYGIADFLVKTVAPSQLGDYSYEVVDTKLSQTTKASTLLQLSLYSWMVELIQGMPPEYMHVVKPNPDGGFDKETFRVNDYAAYFRLTKSRLYDQVFVKPQNTYPHPVSQCKQCDWWKKCDTTRRADDHLQYVAGLQSAHRTELAHQGIETLADFAVSDIGSMDRPIKGSRVTFKKLHRQAQLQIDTREQSAIQFEVLPINEEFGLLNLPEPTAGDVFFDLEAARFYKSQGLEYLFGVWYREDDHWIYKCWWAFDFSEERQSFRDWTQWIWKRLERYPSLHIYHYSHYEPTAMKKLMTRYGTGEKIIDWLLRGERFVDLRQIFRRTIRAGIEGYGLKDVEPLIGYSRKMDLDQARSSLRLFQQIMEMGDPTTIPEEVKEVVRHYNEEDCEATMALRDWLEQKYLELQSAGTLVTRRVAKTGEASELNQEASDRQQILKQQLHKDLPLMLEECRIQDRPYWILGHLVNYFEVEAKSVWWEYFEIKELDAEDLFYDPKALVGLNFVEELPKKKAHHRSLIRYSFPDQEFNIKVKEDVCILEAEQFDESKIGTVHAIDLEHKILGIKQKRKFATLRPSTLHFFMYIRPGAVKEAVLSFADYIIQQQVQRIPVTLAIWELLGRRKPRLKSNKPFLQNQDEPIIDQAIKCAEELDQSTLAIQGPPGTGKTYNGSHLIVHLHRMGYKVGVTATSKKVIEGMLKAIYERGAEHNYAPRLIMKRDKKGCPDYIAAFSDNDKTINEIVNATDRPIAGGTAWLWSISSLYQELDYLVIDEAGQMSLAYVLAAGMSAKNLILLGDPQQLEQPQKGAHPEGVGISALQHYISDQDTMPADRGLFIPKTWRLHPNICDFISTLYYNNRLQPEAHTRQNQLVGHETLKACGLYVHDVFHEGNRNRCMPEVDAVDRIVHSLIDQQVQWTEFDPVHQLLSTARITKNDILIIAPYNMQVNLLKTRLPGYEIGTVDKFQGKEAPVVIYSTTSSSAEEAPRGLEFLYDPHRLNVAVSRAKGVFIMVASPKLFEPDCTSPKQMELANGFCLFREMAKKLSI